MPDFFRRTAGVFTQSADQGWRRPQIGALGALAAQWSLEESEATLISIPTGTGKTAVAMASPYLAERTPGRVLVVASAQAIRKQLVESR